ncbi:hypothetical protein A3Q56_03170, partial [Intoshia linei]
MMKTAKTIIIVGSGISILLLTYSISQLRKKYKKRKYLNNHDNDSEITLVSRKKKNTIRIISPCSSIYAESSEDEIFEIDTARKLYNKGLDSLRTCLSLWEKSIELYERRKNDENNKYADMRIRLHQLYSNSKRLLKLAYSSQTLNVAIDAASNYTLRSDREITESNASFMTALESPDLDDFDTIETSSFLYNEGIKAVSCSLVGCRVLRTELVGCSSDLDFLAKLYCIRNSFDTILRSHEKREFVQTKCIHILKKILEFNDIDSKGFMECLQKLQDYTEINLDSVMEEYRDRGISVYNFYDIVIDYILLDALQELESPSSSMVGIVRNRWISQRFKQMTISSAIWGVLK